MTMDLISGLAVVSSVFMLACALVAIVASRATGAAGIVPDSFALASRVLATVVVVFFIIVADLLLIAQQVSLALGTFVIGVLVVVLLYLEPSIRGGKREAAEAPGTTKEDWRR